MAEVRWVALAEVAKPHGLRGEVRLKVYNRDSDLLLTRREVRLRRKDSAGRLVPIESIREVAGGALLVKFRGVDDRNAAELLRGTEVSVQRDAFPPLEPGEFYVCDVLGATIEGPAGPLGTVEDVVSYPTADALVVRPTGPEKEAVEVPLLDEYVDEVSTDRHVIVLRDFALQLFS
jgi:16S rRNA processing protein RimM